MSASLPTVPNYFKHYMDFSVRADRFFHWVSGIALCHDKLCAMHQALPTDDNLREALKMKSLPEEIRTYISISFNAFGELKWRGLFQSKNNYVGGSVDEDALNFAFYSCFCLQWSLFEDVVKEALSQLLDSSRLPKNIASEIEQKWRKTKQFLDYLESGAVFGKSPFNSLLPQIPFEPCKYKDLDEIRELRNQFIHGVDSPEITSETIIQKHKRYDRSMWVLRQFASNVMWETQQLLS